MAEIPKTTKGVIVNVNSELYYNEMPTDELTADAVLIKVHSGTINPSDISFVNGTYASDKPRPSIGGFEGSGLVVAAGVGIYAQSMLNKRVAFLSGGTKACGSWGECLVMQNAKQWVFPLPDTVSYEQGANALVNPLTAQGFINILETTGQKVVVHSAAASSLGKMFLSLCQKSGIILINVVRKQSQVDTLASLGADHVINTGVEGWQAIATDLFNQMTPLTFFDALGGKTGSELFSLMPDGSTTYNYGGLDGSEYTISLADTIFKNKTLTGYWLTHDLQNPALAVKLGERSFAALATGQVQTTIAKTFPHEQFEEAFAYYKENASQGKVLLQNPNF